MKMTLDAENAAALQDLQIGQKVKIRGFMSAASFGRKPDDPFDMTARILEIVLEVGYPVAVEFAEPVPGGNTCEGRGKAGYCRWVMPAEIMPTS